MKFNVKEDTQNKALQMLKDAEDKTSAIIEVMDMLLTETHEELIQQIQVENEELQANKKTAEQLGLRTSFTQEEKKFLEAIKNPKQAFSGAQADILPTSIVDRTLDGVKEESEVISTCINFAPAGVQKWLTGSKTGTSAWTGLTDALVNELTATITALNLELGKLYVVLVVPKAIRNLANPFVDKYIYAIMKEAFNDGIIKGWAYGDGGNKGPIGVTKQINAFESDGKNSDKTLTAMTGFSPKELAPVKTKLSNNGLRAIKEIVIVANPSDVYNYVDPALYIMNVMGAYVKATKDNVRVIEEPNIVAGKAIVTIPKSYTMGFANFGLKEYDQTKALDDADLLIITAAGNGRADDDNCACVIDVTTLVEATLPKHKA